MSQVTFFVVQPFARSKRGRMVPEEAREAPSAAAAVEMAQRLGAAAGAIAFARTCDPSVSGYADAVVLASVGQVPAEALALTEAI